VYDWLEHLKERVIGEEAVAAHMTE
jgi:hypothetical protein